MEIVISLNVGGKSKMRRCQCETFELRTKEEVFISMYKFIHTWQFCPNMPFITDNGELNPECLLELLLALNPNQQIEVLANYPIRKHSNCQFRQSQISYTFDLADKGCELAKKEWYEGCELEWFDLAKAPLLQPHQHLKLGLANIVFMDTTPEEPFNGNVSASAKLNEREEWEDGQNSNSE